MSTPTTPEVAAARAEGAAQERAAILELIEQAMRQLSHGHGADGALVLQQLVEDVRGRG